MNYPEKEIHTKDGHSVIVRSVQTQDAEIMLDYLKAVAVETPFLVNEPEEITLTMDQEVRFIQANLDNPKAMMIAGFADGRHVGNASFYMVSGKKRFLHRCSIGIALYQEFTGLGIGRQMMEILLYEAKKCGYEQAELEVIAANSGAIALYKSLGFEICGTMKHAMKYKDGTYADMYTMARQL